MSEINKALENLVDVYMARGGHQEAVRAKYAQYEQDLAEAKKQDIDEVAEALVAAWQAGATVAATGQAMGTTNIYAARKPYYSRARVLQGEATAEDADFLQRLYAKAKGVKQPDKHAQSIHQAEEQYVAYFVAEDQLRDWVSSWTLEEIAEDNYTVHDPQERVDKIIKGLIFGFRGKNATEFKDNTTLHALVAEVHNIEMKEF